MNGDYRDRSREIKDTVRTHVGMINERILSLTTAINRPVLCRSGGFHDVLL
ncbi:MAG: hypothetical protein OXB98_01025 [Bryobacterales bacterium]|nr:hypothetical protein [Bryobacterales bacterium]